VSSSSVLVRVVRYSGYGAAHSPTATAATNAYPISAGVIVASEGIPIADETPAFTHDRKCTQPNSEDAPKNSNRHCLRDDDERS